MRHFVHQYVAALCVLSFAMTTAAVNTAAAQGGNPARPGDVVQSVPPPVSQKPQLPPLTLSDDQRAKIKQALSGKNTEVSFLLKTTKPTASFEPAIGAKIPPGLRAHALPPPLIYEMPMLKRYTYLKFKGQVLIVNPMSGQIADMFPET